MRKWYVLVAAFLLWSITLSTQTVEHRWAVTAATGELLFGGPAPYDVAGKLSPQELRVVLFSAPNPRTQKWNGTAVVAKTAAEIMAYDNAKRDERLNNELAARMDAERIFAALTWAILDTYSAPATINKYNEARAKIVNAYKTQPWK